MRSARRLILTCAALSLRVPRLTKIGFHGEGLVANVVCLIDPISAADLAGPVHLGDEMAEFFRLLHGDIANLPRFVQGLAIFADDLPDFVEGLPLRTSREIPWKFVGPRSLSLFRRGALDRLERVDVGTVVA